MEGGPNLNTNQEGVDHQKGEVRVGSPLYQQIRGTKSLLDLYKELKSLGGFPGGSTDEQCIYKIARLRGLI